jgi:peptidyl-Lys metalloendopeptidase
MQQPLKALALGLAGLFAAAVSAAPVNVDLTAVKTQLRNDEDVFVKVTFTNNTAVPQRVLKWHTPFADVEEHIFTIKRDGIDVPYLGAHYKRGEPTAKDYYVLKPGKSYTKTVELSGLYDLTDGGSYTIEYRTHSHQLFGRQFDKQGRAQASVSESKLESGAALIWIDGNQRGKAVSPGVMQMATQALASSLSYSKCTASQQSTVASAVSNASAYANNSNSYLQAGTVGARYTTWFGAYTSSRYNTAKTHFTAIKDAFDTKPIVVDCSCKKSYYAYVYPSQPYKIYVCRAFWNAPMTGTDSKAGTLVHEMSHFNVVAATDDHVYGQSGAKSLAISNPDNALDNADNHEYFAENTPFQN